ncbi:hypothetical protein HHI36_020235 [Cryptolaemus montrouzieri]|uniref:Uncharacterized protein n=1 Tax=Cryptolaemus montrouzieri TaxID=559131 RepID=A0ABD2N9M8_9CUCU
MDDVIKNIEPETIDFEKNNKKSVARIFIGLVKKLIRMIRYNPLRTFIRERIKNSIVYGGFTRIIGIFAGITELLRETSGRILRALLSKTLSIPRLLVTRSSSLILALILKSMKTGASLVLAPIIRSPMTLYRLIHKFGGGVYKGLRGIEALIGHLILFVKRRISLKSLIDIIIQVCATIGKFQINAFKKVIGLILSIIKTVIRGNPISRGLWNGIINFLEKLKNGGLIIHKFNISSIIDLIVKAQTLKLRVLIRICKALRSLISIPKTIAMLFFRMVYFVVSGKGIAFVRRLLPNLHINLDFSRSKEPVIVQIVKLMHPKNLVRSLMSLNIEKLITSIPIIGNIYSTLIETLQEIPAGKPDLIRGLKEDDLKNTLVSWVQYGMGQGGSSPTGEICGMGLSDDEVPLIIEVP